MLSKASIIVLLLLARCSDEHRKKMREEHLSDPQYNYEAVNRASRACGPLVKRAIAQVSMGCTYSSNDRLKTLCVCLPMNMEYLGINV